MYLYILLWYIVHSKYVLVCTEYAQVYTDYVPVYTYMYLNLNAVPYIAGFRGALQDANMRVPDVQQQPADPGSENKGNYNDPCPEDEEFFESRPDAETMEEAINKFMDGMEAQERGGFRDLHRFLGRLPVPTAKASQAMTHTDALGVCFLPSMNEKEQK